MKKIMLMAAFMVAAISANAQNAVGEVTLKPMVGMTIANVTNADGDSKIGLAAGVEAEFGIADKFSVTAGALYSMQGTKYSSNGESVKFNSEYINIPILANYYLAPGFAIKAGIQPAFKTNAKFKANGVEVDSDKMGLDVESFDFSIPVGLSYEYANFVLDARYNWGLTKVWKADNGDDKSKNSVFMISLGYKFAL